jgi:DNA-binding NarL/FixJ family response regulator
VSHDATAPPVPPGRRDGLRVLVVDDHDSFRFAARAVLAVAGFDVVGEAVDGATALHQVEALCPDVVLLDVGLPDLDGFEVCDRLSRLARPPAVVLVSSRDASEYGDRVADSAARGFLPKSRISGPAVVDLVR